MESPDTYSNVHPEILSIFEELLARLWARMVNLIGLSTTVAMFRSARIEAVREYPFLRGIEISQTGIDLQGLRLQLSDISYPALRSGLICFTDEILAIITDLTGHILTRKVKPMIQDFRNRLEEGESLL